MRHARRTIGTLQGLGFFSMFVPAVPLLQHIYTGQGALTQTQIGIVQITVWLVILITDVPTGRLADEYSYKRMLVASAVFYGVAFGLLTFATTFWMFIASSVLWGLGMSCFRGVPNSLARLAIKAVEPDPKKGSKRFASFVRTNLMLGALGEVAASGVAWFIVNNAKSSSLQAVSLASAAVGLVMLWAAAWGLMNLRPKKHTNPRSFLGVVGSGWAETARNVYRAFGESGQLRAMLLFGAIIGCTTQTMVWLSQAYLQRAGVSEQDMPVIWMWYHVGLAGFTLLALPLKNKHGATKVLGLLPLIAVGGYIALILVSANVGQWVVLVFYMIRAIQMPLVQVAMNELSPEHLRATLTGVMSTVQFALFCVMNVAIGWLVDTFSHVGAYGTEVAFGFSAVVYGLLGTIAIRYVRRHDV